MNNLSQISAAIKAADVMQIVISANISAVNNGSRMVSRPTFQEVLKIMESDARQNRSMQDSVDAVINNSTSEVVNSLTLSTELARLEMVKVKYELLIGAASAELALSRIATTGR